MTPSRRWLVVPFVAACALLLCGSVSAQDPPKRDTQPKDKPADVTEVSGLKKDLADTQKKLADAEATLDKVSKSSEATAKKIEDLQQAVDAAKADAANAKVALAKAEGAERTALATKADLTVAKKDAADAKAAADGIKPTDTSGVEKGAADAKAAADAAAAAAADGTNKRGDTAWMLTSSALVMFMLPGLALFYGGMVRRKNVLATMMQSMAALAVVGVYWVAVGYGLAFGPSVVKVDLLGVEGGGLVGWSNDLFFLKGVGINDTLPQYGIPVYVHVMFQGMFAIITPALISGAVAERIRFWPFCIFMILWITLVYCPLAHMVWAFDWFDPTVVAAKRGLGAIGLLGKMGALDFAGGTVVHIAAGMAGLAATLVLRKRDGYPKSVTHPNSMVLTLLGAGLLWFGWFGFNGGSALSAGGQAGSAFAATQAAAAAAGLVWMLIEWLHKGKPTALGLASGIVAGLVAVTPASGYVYAWGGLAIGVAAAAVCYGAVFLKGLLGYDDSLDAFGVHGVGGFVGAVLTGVFCSSAVYSAANDGPFSYGYHEARLAAVQGKAADGSDGLLAKAQGDAAAAAKAVEDEKGKLKYAELSDAATAAAKGVADAKDDAAKAAAQAKLDDAAAKVKEADAALAPLVETETDKKATADALQKELTFLQAAHDKHEDTANGGKDKKGPFAQLVIQLKAALFSVLFAGVLSAALVALVQAMTLGNFTTSRKEETDGLDRTEHGEVGFDFGVATETVTASPLEPRAATTPKGNGRFELAVEGVEAGELRKAWTALCQPSDAPADRDFLAVYPHVTTFTGTTFRLRGGDPAALGGRLSALLKKQFPGRPVKVARA